MAQNQIGPLRPLIALVLCSVLFCSPFSLGSAAQDAPLKSTASPPGDILSQRLEAAMKARDSGDPVAIGQANQQVLALALVEMAKLSLDEKAYDESIRLCRESLGFQDTAE